MSRTVHTLKIGEAADRTMQQDALEAYPNECCGFLYGHETGQDRFVTTARPVHNAREGDQRRRFEISATDYIKAEAYALQHDVILLGVYHSHPQHPAIASGHDLRSALPFFSYVIYSVMDGEVDDLRSWRLRENGAEFLEERVEVIAKDSSRADHHDREKPVST